MQPNEVYSKEADFQHHQWSGDECLKLIIQKEYSLRCSEIINQVAPELWTFIFRMNISDECITSLIPFRLICKNWNQVVCSFPSLSIKTSHMILPKEMNVFLKFSNLRSISICNDIVENE